MDLIKRFLNKNPRLKDNIKFNLDRVKFSLNKKGYEFRCDYELLEFDGFYGYYDKSPSNLHDEYVIFHRPSSNSLSNPDPNCPVEVVVYNKKQMKAVSAVSSYTYNWQQGARAQWLDCDKYIFNDFDEHQKKYISRVFSVHNSSEVKRFDFPVQDSFSTKYFLSINYKRLMALRPDYGYRNLPKLSTSQLLDQADDGIWLVNYATGEHSLIYSFEQILNCEFKSEFQGAIHKINHVMISPNGQEFIFLHRYYLNGKRFHRLMKGSLQEQNLTLLSNFGMVSHCSWADNDHVVGYLKGPTGEDSYWLIDVRTSQHKKIADERLEKFGDGHPNVFGDWFVTDTYPDNSFMQHLILVNWKTGYWKLLGEFRHGISYRNESRCDLHPRFSKSGKSIFFDSVFTGKRKLYELKINLNEIN